MKNTIRTFLATLVIGLFAQSAFAQERAQIRVSHLSPDAPAVDVYVDGTRVLAGVAYPMVSGCLEVPGGDYNLKVTPAGLNEPVVIDANITLSGGTAYTVAATGLVNAGDLRPIMYVDNRVPHVDLASVRFVHTSPDAPAVDIAVTGGPVLFSNVSFREASPYASLIPGEYDLEVRLGGTETVALRLPGVMLDGGVNSTVFATGLVADNSLGALPTRDAKVPELRVAHFSPDAPEVDVWVDGTRALESVPFGMMSDYLKVNPGDRRIQVSPAGASAPIVIDATVSLKVDTAYTAAATGLLADGDLQALALVDDREVDTDGAKVRFVHTGPDAPAVDIAGAGGPVLFGNVAFREASDYLTVAPGTYDLEVRVAGTETVALTISGVRLGAGTNYTLFAIGLLSDGSLAALPAVDADIE